MSHYKPDPNKNVNLTINGIPVTVPEGTRILEAAKKVNVNIPTLCDHPDLCRRSVCRLCVVECDGREKLMAACANDVWEGVNIVTNNLRLINIRRTIIELLLANHPNDCLNCIRNKNCSLQTLAADFNISNSAFFHTPDYPEKNENKTDVIIRDMSKCVKCGRCTEACQVNQAVCAINSSGRGIHYGIVTPYSQSLEESPCVFCGHCASVCPVGAIHEKEQVSGLIKDLIKHENNIFIQFNPSLIETINEAIGFSQGDINTGKIITALKMIGFKKVFDSEIAENASINEEIQELLRHKKANVSLPLITGCSHGFAKFVTTFFPDLEDRLYKGKSGQDNFCEEAGPITVSVEQCLAKKYKAKGIVLTVPEIVLMFKMMQINLKVLPESVFDVSLDEPQIKAPFKITCQDVKPGINSQEIEIYGIKIKVMTAGSYSDAGKIIELIRRGECDADYVRISGCK